jgi:hypothetical protein
MAGHNKSSSLKGTKMFNDFDTQIQPEETNEYSDYVSAEELAAIESEELDIMDDVFPYDGSDELVYESFDGMLDEANQFDEDRDFDFYES